MTEITPDELLRSDNTEPLIDTALSLTRPALVPKHRREAAGYIIYMSGLSSYETQYMALALVPGWLCLCDVKGIREYIPYEEIKRVSLKEVSGFAFPKEDPEGGIVHVRIRQAKALSIEIDRDTFTDELLVATERPNIALEWQRRITNSIRMYLNRRGGGQVFT